VRGAQELFFPNNKQNQHFLDILSAHLTRQGECFDVFENAAIGIGGVLNLMAKLPNY
jgi:hypothetical protein